MNAAARLALAQARLYLDISPLLEQHWTGIPVVTAGLASALLAQIPGELAFVLDLSVIDPAIIATVLARTDGQYLRRAIDAGHAVAGRLPLLQRQPGPSIGLFPTVKRLRRAFTVECSLVHDLSTLVLPQYHQPLNVAHHMESLVGDLATNDLTIAVSAATRDDLVAYLGADPAKILVVPNGVSWPAHFAAHAANLLARGSEPYVLTLGTREPRKNILLIFDMLAAHPELLESHRYVFAGKMGWLEELHALPPVLEPAVAAGRILFPGFVSEQEKFLLLAGAQATLYPSFFEGFGLPVLESLSAGTPCAASWSSAIPEAGGGLCTYFDPLNAESLYTALQTTLARMQAEGSSLRRACSAHAARFTWSQAASTILEALIPLLPA